MLKLVAVAKMLLIDIFNCIKTLLIKCLSIAKETLCSDRTFFAISVILIGVESDDCTNIMINRVRLLTVVFVSSYFGNTENRLRNNPRSGIAR